MTYYRFADAYDSEQGGTTMATVERLYAYMLLAFTPIAAACGLDGLRGTVTAINSQEYVLRDSSGRDHHARFDENSHKDAVVPGDEVRIFMTKDGHAQFLMKLEQ
jgi:hypothetical protein